MAESTPHGGRRHTSRPDGASELHVDDARLLGPQFHEYFLQWRSEHTVDELIAHLTRLANRPYACAFASLHFAAAFSNPAVADARLRICCLRSARQSWGIAVIDAYDWKSESTRFCKALRCLARRCRSWRMFVGRLNRVLYESLHAGKGHGKVCSFHLTRLQKQWDDVVPLQTSEDLPSADRSAFAFDAFGKLCRSSAGEGQHDRRRRQIDAFGCIQRPARGASIYHNGDLVLPAINYYARHLTQRQTPPSQCLVLPATRQRPARFFDSPHVPYFRAVIQLLRGTSWFAAIQTTAGVDLLDPTGYAAPPAGWKKGSILKPSRAVTASSPAATALDSTPSGILLLGYLPELLRDPVQLVEQLREGTACVRIDVPVLREDMELVFRSLPAEYKGHDTLVVASTAVTQVHPDDDDSAEQAGATPSHAAANENHEMAAILAGVAVDATSHPASTPAAVCQQTETANPAAGEVSLRLVRHVPSPRDIGTLEARCFLNDGMVNYGLYVLGRRSPLRRCFFFNSHLLTELQRGRPCTAWLKGDRLAAYDAVLVPVHDRARQHWCLVVLWPTVAEDACTFSAVVLDPLETGAGQHDGHRQCCLLLEVFLRSLGTTRLVVEPPPHDLPKQRDNHSCGLFVLKYAEHILGDDLDRFKRAVREQTGVGWPEIRAEEERAVWRERTRTETAATAVAQGIQEDGCRELASPALLGPKALPEAGNAIAADEPNPPAHKETRPGAPSLGEIVECLQFDEDFRGQVAQLFLQYQATVSSDGARKTLRQIELPAASHASTTSAPGSAGSSASPPSSLEEDLFSVVDAGNARPASGTSWSDAGSSGGKRVASDTSLMPSKRRQRATLPDDSGSLLDCERSLPLWLSELAPTTENTLDGHVALQKQATQPEAIASPSDVLFGRPSQDGDLLSNTGCEAEVDLLRNALSPTAASPRALLPCTTGGTSATGMSAHSSRRHGYSKETLALPAQILGLVQESTTTEFVYFKELSIAVTPDALQQCAHLHLPDKGDRIYVFNGVMELALDAERGLGVKSEYTYYVHTNRKLHGALSKERMRDSFLGYVVDTKDLSLDLTRCWNEPWIHLVQASRTFNNINVRTFVSRFGNTGRHLLSSAVDAVGVVEMLHSWEFYQDYLG